jgi:hypothetical protein
MTIDEQNMLSECLADESDKLTAWEIEFLENLARLPEGWTLTGKQAAKLRQINEKVIE